MKKYSFQELLLKKGIKIHQKDKIVHKEQADYFPLSWGQESIWFLQQLDVLSPVYNNPSAIKIKGELNRTLLEKSLNEMLNRHSIINSNYFNKDNGTWQIIQKKELDISYSHINEWIDDNKGFDNRNLENIINTIAKQPFDLEKDSMLKVSIIELSKDEYIIILNIHHIVSDGWSKGIILKEVAALYKAFANGEPSPLLPLKLQYNDYVRWLRRSLSNSKMQKQLAFWKEKLKDLPAILPLPTDYPRPSVYNNNGSLFSFSLKEPLTKSIKDFCQDKRLSLFHFFLSAFNILLYKYTSEEDILVGTPISGRNRTEFEDVIGLFVNTIVIRNELSGDIKLLDFLQRVKEESIEAYNNQEFPFDLLVKTLNPVRELSITPVFQVMFQFDNTPKPPLKIDQLELTPIEFDTGMSQFDLSVSCWEEDKTVKGTFEFNTDLFKLSTVQKMQEHFINLLEEMIDKPTKEVHQLSILSEKEKDMIVFDWNDTYKEIKPQQHLIQMFEQNVLNNPEAVAICNESRRVSYKDLNIKINWLSLLLLKKGVKKESVVVIYVSDTIEVITAMLAIIKTGAAFSVIDPEYPNERVRYILKDLNKPFILTNERFTEILNYPEDLLILFEHKNLKNKYIDNSDTKIHHHNLLCIIYTSGSTGTPKGVLLEHGNLVNLVISFIESYDVKPQDALMPITAIGSASFVGEVLPILAAGGKLALPSMASVLDIDRLIDFMNKENVTIISTVPSMIGRLNATDKNSNNLRLVLSGGETLLPSHIKYIDTNIKVVNGYGLTETGICNTYTVLNNRSDGIELISLGKPIVNNQVYILDSYLNCVPEGVIGEIYVSGKSIGRGYLNNLDLNRSLFLENPFQGKEKMFKTGDIGYWLSNGELCFLGRNDNQVQIRGFRIELGEIEKQIGMHHMVSDVAVVAHTANNGNKYLVSYISTLNLQIINTNEIKESLQQKLPDYMIPRYFVVMDSLPYKKNGKIQIEQLPIPSFDSNQEKIDYEVPKTEVEKQIAKIWEEILQTSTIGINDNFFDIGGHSLLLSQVFSRLKKYNYTELDIIDLLKYSTIKLLANYISNQDKEALPIDSVLSKAKKRTEAMNRIRKVTNKV